MREKIKNSKFVQSEKMQKLGAAYRMLINVTIILGTAALASYLVTQYDDKVIIILGAASAAVSLFKLIQVSYLAELKVVKR